MKDSFVSDSGELKWQLLHLTLEPMSGRWVWLVRYSALPEGGFVSDHNLTLVVLMDGTVVQPRVDQ
jgi:hypothetical protein